jgi:peptidoglycan/LPS O-acetylase OafA/YrhL
VADFLFAERIRLPPSHIMMVFSAGSVTKANRMPALDGMRGVAILMVLFVHASLTVGLTQPEWLERMAAGGSHGVQLFFVVSAFTLTTGWRGLNGYARSTGHLRAPDPGLASR